MKKLLFLVHRIPFPPDKGDKIRSFNLLRHLSKRFNVYVGGFVDREEDWKYVDEVEKYCSGVFFRPLGRWGSRLSAAGSLVRLRSLSVGFYSDKRLSRWVEKLLHDVDVDTVVAFSSTMAQFLPRDMPKEIIVLADFVDLDSDKWRQYAAEARWPLSSIYAYEAKALADWELKVVDSADAITLVSAEECRLMLGHLGAGREKIDTVRNGVDADFFDPAIELENPYPAGRPVAIFTGAMDYFANVQGVKWFSERIWPEVRKKAPTAEFWIVGSNPTSEVLALEAIDGVVVTGYVSDIRPYLRYASLAVTPLQLARGVQNKVLEALAMELPVVATPQALQGLDGSLPASVTSASDAADFAAAVSDLFAKEKSAHRNSGRSYVQEFYDWEQNLTEVDRILTSASERKADLDASESRP